MEKLQELRYLHITFNVDEEMEAEILEKVLYGGKIPEP